MIALNNTTAVTPTPAPMTIVFTVGSGVQVNSPFTIRQPFSGFSVGSMSSQTSRPPLDEEPSWQASSQVVPGCMVNSVLKVLLVHELHTAPPRGSNVAFDVLRSLKKDPVLLPSIPRRQRVKK